MKSKGIFWRFFDEFFLTNFWRIFLTNFFDEFFDVFFDDFFDEFSGEFLTNFFTNFQHINEVNEAGDEIKVPGKGILALRRVLSAYAYHNPRYGNTGCGVSLSENGDKKYNWL